MPMTLALSDLGRLETYDTADWKSALRAAPFAVGHAGILMREIRFLGLVHLVHHREIRRQILLFPRELQQHVDRLQTIILGPPR